MCFLRVVPKWPGRVYRKIGRVYHTIEGFTAARERNSSYWSMISKIKITSLRVRRHIRWYNDCRLHLTNFNLTGVLLVRENVWRARGRRPVGGRRRTAFGFVEFFTYCAATRFPISRHGNQPEPEHDRRTVSTRVGLPLHNCNEITSVSCHYNDERDNL